MVSFLTCFLGWPHGKPRAARERHEEGVRLHAFPESLTLANNLVSLGLSLLLCLTPLLFPACAAHPKCGAVWCLWLCRSARLSVRRGCGLYLEPCAAPLLRPFPQLRRPACPLAAGPPPLLWGMAPAPSASVFFPAMFCVAVPSVS